MFQVFLTVYLSNSEQHFTEVPVTPETICRDVVDLCKEPGESDCHLAEVWCGSGMDLAFCLSSVVFCCFGVLGLALWEHLFSPIDSRVGYTFGGYILAPTFDDKAFCSSLFLQQKEVTEQVLEVIGLRTDDKRIKCVGWKLLGYCCGQVLGAQSFFCFVFLVFFLFLYVQAFLVRHWDTHL